ncbi:MAG: 4Fe-4S binding protein [Phycisphaerae bacterium]|jgi:polyferredoxin|nr:4Fe-4S binding protein [Phycisphaerae bacterium]
MPNPSTTSDRNASKKGPRGTGHAIHLPVLTGPHNASGQGVAEGAERLRRRRRLRLFVLLGVHVLIAVHLTHWLVTGESIGRFVLSDAMEALELGRIGPGALLFAAAMSVTLVAGRWLCGWACHMGALQDGCAWVLRRLGLRPRPFRTHVLGYVPLITAFLMFAWPTLRRVVFAPLADHLPFVVPSWLASHAPAPAWQWQLTSEHLWRGLPSAAVAIPFLLVCGGATVFFLGTRGFCRYGCPYGGAFSAAEPIAPMRVTVDLAICDGCGRCTAACNSGVTVHEEVRAHGRVISSGCQRSLDCIAVCPHQALRLGVAKPAWMADGAILDHHRFDTSLGEEILLGSAFLVAFLASRGLYGIIPLFFALGIAICVTSLAWHLWRTARTGVGSLCGMALRKGGQWTLAGSVSIVAGGILGGIVLHSFGIQACLWHAGRLDDRIVAPRSAAFSSLPSILGPADEKVAQEALDWYLTAGSLGKGGWGLAGTPAADVRVGWLRLLLRDYRGAADALCAAIPWAEDPDRLVADLARVLLLADDPDGAVQALEAFIGTGGECEECRRLLRAMSANTRERVAP